MRNKPIIFGIMAILAFTLWSIVGGQASKRYYAPEAYTRRVNNLIKSGYLTAKCEIGKPPRIDASKLEGRNAHQAAVTTNDSPEVTAKLESDRLWYKNSYLKEDIRRFNVDPVYNWVFAIGDNCTLNSINDSVRSIAMPFASQERWQGNILYSDQAEVGNARLQSSKRQISLHYPTPQDPPYISAGVGDDKVVDASRVLLQFSGYTQQAAKLYYVDDKVVINNLTDDGYKSTVSIIGYRMPTGRHSWLAQGDWIKLQTPAPYPMQETFVFVDATPQQEGHIVASKIRRHNGIIKRDFGDHGLGWFYDSNSNQPIPYLRILTQRIDSVLNQYPDVSKDFDLQLTIQRKLQEDISQAFHNECSKLSKSKYQGQPFKAGVTIMNGKTGAILATATYPWPEDVPEELDTRERMLLNQNFVRHPSGSAIKPFLYAAIAHDYPYFLNMTIGAYQPDSKHSQILYCKVADYEVDSHGNDNGKNGRMSLARALTISSNKYTVELATLGLAADTSGIRRHPHLRCPGTACSSININNQALNYAPDLTQYIDVTSTRQTILCNKLFPRFDGIPFRIALEHLTGVPTVLGYAPDDQTTPCLRQSTAQANNMSILQPLLRHLLPTQNSAQQNSERICNIYPMFKSVAPEQVNFAFNTFNDFRNDYVTFALGGGTSNWTNIQLAESMSRLVTNKPVDALLLTLLDPKTGQNLYPPPAPTDSQFLSNDVREAVLTGLAGVVTSGTGHDLMAPFDALKRRFPKHRIFIFSKTGTPTTVEQIPRETGLVLKQLDLSYQNNLLHIKFNGQTATYSTNNSENFYSLLGQSIKHLGYRGRKAQLINELTHIFDNFLEMSSELSWSSQAEVPATIEGPLYMVANQLRINEHDDVFEHQQRKAIGAVYVFSLVKIPNNLISPTVSIPTMKQIQDHESQITTVAMHLFLNQKSPIAVQVAGRLLERIGLTLLSKP